MKRLVGKIVKLGFIFIGLGVGFLRIFVLQGHSEYVTRYGFCGSINGVVVKENGLKDASQKLVIKIESIGLETNVYAFGQGYFDFVPTYHIGDKLSFNACLAETNIYLARKNIFYFFNNVSNVTNLKTQNPIYLLRNRVISTVERFLTEPYSSILLGMTIGYVAKLPAKFELALRNTGTTHLIAVSGYNTTLVANSVVNGLTGIFGKFCAIICSLAFLLCFVFISGGSIPVVRAFIMTAFTLVGVLLGYPVSKSVAFLLSIFIILLIWPQSLFDISFQLSVLATAGLIFVAPVVARLLRFIPTCIREELCVGISAMIVTAPVIASTFGTVSIISILPNLIVSFFIELITIWGGLAIIVGVFSRGFASILLSPVIMLMAGFRVVIEFFSKFEFATIPITITTLVLILAYSCILFFILIANYE
ncbi:ComEC/Rec2 family competence protein [Candidatus Dojkabacteria bacterium]|nr:ComEC/Rec2 family competence protein [Candidatus Dojkabacteria bacterium]